MSSRSSRSASASVGVAVFGAAGAVGREMLNILAQRRFPTREVVAVASRRSLGREVSFGDSLLKCRTPDSVDFSSLDLCLMSAGSDAAQEWAPRIAESGCLVIDNSSRWRYDDDVPLIVPEVNGEVLRRRLRKASSRSGIVANPNCSTAQLVVALKPLHDAYGVKRVSVATYQAASGAGRDASDELWRQTKRAFGPDPMPSAGASATFPKRLAFNVIPRIDRVMDDGRSREEWKLDVETRKILDPAIRVSATAVRVPVFVGHAEAANVELASEFDVEEARQRLRDAPGCLVVDRPEDDVYMTPAECAGDDAVFVSRIRRDETLKNGISMWIVSDNLRKGAALNAVQIAEEIIA